MKFDKSIADYAAIAVAPVLIFIMISSLANFLVLILYHGSYPQRIAWTLLMFTMGSVALARVAIEQSRAHSIGYGAALGAATFVVMSQFVGSPLFCGFILVVIAYLADVIVRDCTIIDDAIDASGEGLIDAGRLFVKKRFNEEERAPITPDHRERAKTHQPGRTVMYLALGALPLFGFGQFMLRSDALSWSRAQFFLAFYLFAALALLVTTSFLGLRRYLRQRDAEMPNDVTASWLGGGIAMIAAILLIAYVVPLPGRTLASIELPDFVNAKSDRSANSAGWGDEGADHSRPDAATTSEDPQAEKKEIHSQTMQEGGEAGDVGDGDRADGPAGKQTGGDQQTAGSENPSQEESKESKQQSDGQSERESSQDPADESSQQPDSQQPNSQQTEPSDRQNPPPDSNSDQSPTDRDPQADDRARSSESTAQPSFSSLVSGLGSLLKWLIVAVLTVIVIGFVWLNRDRFFAWLQGLLNADKPESNDSVASWNLDPQEPPKPFSAYRNPIGSEPDPRRVVVITFQAFEAWSREQGAIRGRDETPTEFVRRASLALPSVGKPVSQVVDAYNRIVYGRGPASQGDVDAAQQVWRLMS